MALLAARGPADVAGLVVAVVVESVKTVLRSWAWPDMGKKYGEVMWS